MFFIFALEMKEWDILLSAIILFGEREYSNRQENKNKRVIFINNIISVSLFRWVVYAYLILNRGSEITKYC